MLSNKKDINLRAILIASSIVLCACQSDSSPQSDSQETQPTMQNAIDYTGIWMTTCLSVDDQNSSTGRIELTNGEYRMETYSYDGQDCNAIENQDFSRIDTGTYVINDIVEVPSGVVAHGITLFVKSRVLNGEQVDVSDDQGTLDLLHRSSNRLYLAKGERVGVAGVFFPEDIDFSTVYYLQEK